MAYVSRDEEDRRLLCLEKKTRGSLDSTTWSLMDLSVNATSCKMRQDPSSSMKHRPIDGEVRSSKREIWHVQSVECAALPRRTREWREEEDREDGRLK